MKAITHKQARRYMLAVLDGLLTEEQRRDLQMHLDSCPTCLSDSQSFSTLTSRLQSEFHSRWDEQDGPSHNLLQNIRSQTRRIIMSNRIVIVFKWLAGVAALAVFLFAFNSILPQMRDLSTTADNTQTESQRLVAFTSAAKDGNFDIYTMHPDGSGLTDLTQNEAHDTDPFWSPDGKRIAFLSDRTGFVQIFLMDSDGSSLIQLTDAETDHRFDGSNAWSPDGNKLLFSERMPGDEKWMLYSIDVNGQNKTLLTPTPDRYDAASWSPDGKHIAYVAAEHREDRDVSRIYVVDANGSNTVNITRMLPEDEDLSTFNYTWTREGNIRFAANRYYWESDISSAKYTFYETTLDGHTLVEIANTSTPLVDWWDGTTFVMGLTGEKLTWLRSDATFSEFKPFEKCQMGTESQYSSFYSKRSPDGYLMFGASCPNGDLWIYLANPKGTTIKQLFDAPIKTEGVGEIFWSPDGRYAVITFFSSGKFHMNIVDLQAAMKAPLAIPDSIALSGDNTSYNISWQPLP